MRDLSFLSRLPEALDYYEPQGVGTGQLWNALLAAARLVSDEWVSPCPNCEETGTDASECESPMCGLDPCGCYSCPSCNGRGLVLSKQAIERGAVAAQRHMDGRTVPTDAARLRAAAVLWAVLDGEGE